MLDSTSRRWLLPLTGVIVLAHLPLLVVQVQDRWRYPHYQYVPLLLTAAAALAWSRRALPVREQTPRPRLALGLLLGSLLLLGVGVLLYSPWLASVALLLALAGLGLAWQGRGAVTRFGAVWALLWLAVPLPMNWDQTLIAGLQSTTSRVSSDLLDLFGVDHLMAGNVLELPDRTFLVEEACSGVQSLFALVAAVGAFLVWRRRPWTVAVVMLPAAMAAAVLMNVLRVTAIALAYHAIGLDLSKGWPHEVLGFGTFALAMLVLTAIEQVVRFVVAPIAPPDLSREDPLLEAMPRGIRESAEAVGSWWNRVIAGVPEGLRLRPQPLLVGVPIETAGTGPGPLQAPAAIPARDSRPGLPALLTLPLFAALTLVQWWFWDPSPRTPLPILENVARLDAGSMPERSGSWTRVAFEREHRLASSNFGEHSAIWDYRGDGHITRFACDYPFSGWHELLICYRNIGWTVEARQIVPARPVDGRMEAPYVMATMSKPTGERSLLCFSLVDRAGEPLEIPEGQQGGMNPLQMLRNRWQKGLYRLKGRGESYQIQAITMSDSTLSPQAERELSDRFLSLRRALMTTLTGPPAP